MYGENGTGKTTVLQAIEWALTGTVSNFTGFAFKEEDAFINMFSGRKKCNVVLQILAKRGEKSVLIERIRKLSKNSSTTKTNTQLLLSNGKALTAAGAQQELLNILGVNSNNFIRNFYIRQDLVHELLEENPEEISRGLDEILGTTNIRHLIDSIDIKSKINACKRSIDKRIEGLKSDKIAIADNVKQTAEKIKSSLIGKGFLEEELSLNHSLQILNNLVTCGKPLADHFTITSYAFNTEDITLANLKSSIERYIDHLQELDTKRQEICSYKSKESNNISNLLTSADGIITSLSSFGNLEAGNLDSQQKWLALQLDEIRISHEKLTSMVEQLTEAKFQLDSIKQKILSLNNEISELCLECGDIKKQEDLINQNRERLNEIGELLESTNLFESLVHKSIEYIKKTKENKCPICDRDIDHNKLLLLLQNKITHDLIKRLDAYKQEESALLDGISKMNANLSQLINAKSKLQIEEDSFNKLMTTSRRQAGLAVDESIESKIEFLKNDLHSKNDRSIDLQAKVQIIQDKISTFNSLVTSKSNLEKELQAILKSSNIGSKIIDEAKTFKSNIEDEIESLEINGEYQIQINHLKQEINNLLCGLVNYLEQEQQINNLMHGINENSDSIQRLKEKKYKLELLEGSLNNIKVVASQYLEKEVQSQIGKQGQLIDNIYNKIIPHPVFRHITIDVNNKDPIVYSIKVSDDTELKTSALARFSMAQMNIFAISVLFANNIKLCEQFPVLLLDDPTHSMDDRYKQHLSEFISEIGKDRQVILADF